MLAKLWVLTWTRCADSLHLQYTLVILVISINFSKMCDLFCFALAFPEYKY